MNKDLAVKSACYHFNYKWPSDQWTGVIFFHGHRITVEEFIECAKKFKEIE